MKKLFFLFAFVGLFGFTSVNAQCTHGQAKATKTAALQNNAAAMAAAKFAANDETIESRTCSKSGRVSYYKKSVGEGGEVSYAPVSFDMAKKAFVMADATASAGCSKGAKACCKGGAKSCSKGAKACCKGGAKSCSKGAGASCTHSGKACTGK